MVSNLNSKIARPFHACSTFSPVLNQAKIQFCDGNQNKQI